MFEFTQARLDDAFVRGMFNETNRTRPMTLSFAEVNKLHADFWAREKALTAIRMEDETNSALAMTLLRHDERRQPFGLWMRFEVALEQAEDIRRQDLASQITPPAHEILERIKREVAAEFARRGGRARKLDALSRVIRKIVRARPQITKPELLDALNARAGIDGVIVEIDDKEGIISFLDRGILREALISGLKDRLSEAKKELGFGRSTARKMRRPRNPE